MKRLTMALFTMLTLAFVGLSPTIAQAAAVTCTVQSIPGVVNILRTCDGVSSFDIGAAKSALAVQRANALGKLQDGHHWFFVFAQAAQWQPYSVANPTILPYPSPAPPAGIEGYTWENGLNTYSVILIDQLAAGSNNHTQNAVAHEAGHHFDAFYSAVLGGADAASEGDTTYAVKLTGAQFIVGGGPPDHPGDTVAITFSVLNTTMIGNPPHKGPNFGTYKTDTGIVSVVTVTKTIATGDTLDSVAAWFVDQINNHTTPSLNSLGVQAIATSPASATFYIHSKFTVVRYSKATVGGYVLTMDDHDWSNFINKSPPYATSQPQCTGNGAGTFNFFRDDQKRYICSGTTGGGASLNTPYVGMDNAQIQFTAWSYFYVQTLPASTIPGWTELWAETVASQSGFNESPPDSPDAPFINNFGCTRQLQQDVLFNGMNPPETNFGSPCRGQ
jgi:hypothetical protein